MYIHKYIHAHSFQNEMKNMEDACDELLLVDGDENIPFFMGEVFIYHGMEQTQVQYKSFIMWIFYYISVLWDRMEIVNSKIQVILSSSFGAQKYTVKDCDGLLLSSQQPIFGPLPEPVHCSHLHSEFLCFLPIAKWNESDTKSLSQIALHINVFWTMNSVCCVSLSHSFALPAPHSLHENFFWFHISYT